MKKPRIRTSAKLGSPRPWFIVATACFLVMLVTAVIDARFILNSDKVTGTVVRLDESLDQGKTYYSPEFTYTLPNGKTYTGVSTSGSYPPRYAVGQAIALRYDRTRPSDVKIDSIWELWSFPLWSAIMGALSTILAYFLKSRTATRSSVAVLAAR